MYIVRIDNKGAYSMRKRKLLVMLSLVGLLSSCGGDTPVEVDYIAQFKSMLENVQKYDGPLTISSRTYGTEGIQEYDYHSSSSYDSYGYRYYDNNEINNTKIVFVPESESKIGTTYYKGSNNSYKTTDVYSRSTKKASYYNKQHDLFTYLKLMDSMDLLKEYVEFYSWMYAMQMIQEAELVLDPISFSYNFSIVGNNLYQFSCTSSRWAYVTSKEEKPNCLYQGSLSVVYDKDFLYSISSTMVAEANYSDNTSSKYAYNQSYNYSFSFDEENYNSYKAELIAAELPSISPSANHVNIIAYGSALTTQTVDIGAQVNFESIESYIEERYQVNVEGFYYDKELTNQITSLVSDEADIKVYVKFTVNSGRYLFIRETTVEKVALPGDYMSPELYQKLYYDENYYRYVSIETPAYGEEIMLNLSNTENREKILSVSVDNEPYDTYKVSFASGDIHYYKKATRKYSNNDGSSENSAVPISVADSINTTSGIYLRTFGGNYCWFKVNTSEILKEDFALAFKNYSSEHLLTSSNISSLTELDKSGVEIVFNINGETVTSIPEGYSGDIYFRTYYEGPAKLHYLLIG